MSGRLIGPGGSSLSSLTMWSTCTGACPGTVNELRARGALMYINAMAADLPPTNSETISAASLSRCTNTTHHHSKGPSQAHELL